MVPVSWGPGTMLLFFSEGAKIGPVPERGILCGSAIIIT